MADPTTEEIWGAYEVIGAAMSAWNGSVTNRDIERPKARIDGHGGDFTPDPNWPSILELATQLWGKPTSRKSTEVRFGTNGGRKVWPQKNTWHDFEFGRAWRLSRAAPHGDGFAPRR